MFGHSIVHPLVKMYPHYITKRDDKLIEFIYDYLERIYFDAAGLPDDQPEKTAAKQKDYSVIEGYKVADYKEQPHTYMEE